MVVLLLFLGIVLMASIVAFFVASFVVYVRIKRFCNKPSFSILSVPGYLVTFCKKEHCDIKSEISAALHVVRAAQVVVFVSGIVLLVLITGYTH